MADESQVAMLKRSVQEWNQWRKQIDSGHKVISGPLDLATSNLDGADLRTANLGGVTLSHASLEWTNLEKVNLAGADLSRSRLWRANLSWASLRNTNFSNASMELADLTGADVTSGTLTKSQLVGAIFRFTVVDDADFAGAHLGETVFAGMDLSSALGLLDCEHESPSYLDHHTLTLSRPLPLEFMRGASLSDRLIDLVPSLRDESLPFHSCFISYSTQDQDFAGRLRANLRNSGVRCWFARHDIKGGRKLHEQIDEAIRIHNRLLLILSDASMSSEWVKTEIANARQKELAQKCQVLFPISLVPFDRIREWRCFDADTGKDSAREIREYFIPDFSNWKDPDSYKAAFDKLLKGLKAD